jgi:cytochrome P450
MAVVKVPISREITGHKAVREALRNTAEFSSDLQGDADVRDYRQLPLEVDPPRHHLFRTALTPFFVRPAIEKHIPAFEALATKTLRDFFSKVDGEVVSELALPLVMKNLGVIYNRPQDVDEWISWGPDVWTAAGPERSGDVLLAYLERIYQEAITKPSADIYTEIAQLEIDGEVVSEIEFRGIVGVLLAGGRDTVVKLMTGMVWYFGNNPEALQEVRDNPVLIDGAIQEFLRFLTPLPAMARTTVPESTTSELPADRYVQISFISGNFDETVFTNPTEIDFTRARNPHLSFGFGPHTCLGNHVAEIEAKVFLKALLALDIDWQISPKSEITYFPGKLSNVPNHLKSIYITLENGKVDA